MNRRKYWKTDSKRFWILASVVLLLVQLCVLFYYGNRKAGFHEDEFYSYYSTNKTAGLFVTDRQWLDRDSYRNDFVVLPGEGFRYEVVAKMQSWDVHPPFYYFLLHTVCSFFPGVFSKWLGIAVNIIGYIPCFFLLWYLAYRVAAMETSGRTEKCKTEPGFYACLTCMMWGFGAAVISGVMFIRMYQWLTLFVLLCACLHVRAMAGEAAPENGKKSRGLSFWIPLCITVYLGFLTQYYYIIFHIFLGAGFCFLLLRHKKIKELLCYVLTCATGLGAAILSYPASMSHIFRGYRGTEAVSEFGDASNTLGRLRFFVGLFDDYMMNDTLSVWLLLVCLLFLAVAYMRKKQAAGLVTGVKEAGKQVEEAGRREEKKESAFSKGEIIGLLVFACAGYFFTVSKTALLLGETSNRYQLPIYGLLIFLLLYFLISAGEYLAKQWQERGNGRIRGRRAAGIVLFTAVLLIDGMALKDNKVFFLYEEEAEIMAYVKENSQVPVVVFYNEASSANVWRLSDELMKYPRIYLASQGNRELITDETITESKKLLVYVADYDNQEACLQTLLNSNKNLTGYEKVAEKNLWTLYVME